ncbi:hypothetical protein [Hymenobacter sublimis]|uniref:Uncharacterized protein n=1 Tax=Hymenobacter sublimis TaxID=2933777 RepID=A0ABY4JDL2_9BACT|nr:hypothetical protein [Hymenobacter sublimis]UPL50521.1 hypothetical protein MWH26_06340 [Hymenobacter sublimis]
MVQLTNEQKDALMNPRFKMHEAENETKCWYGEHLFYDGFEAISTILEAEAQGYQMVLINCDTHCIVSTQERYQMLYLKMIQQGDTYYKIGRKSIQTELLKLTEQL